MRARRAFFRDHRGARAARAALFIGSRIVLYIILIVVFVAPLWAILSTAFSARAASTGTLIMFPGDFTFDNLATVWIDFRVWRYFMNSVVVVVLAVVLQTTASVLAAYALARKHFVGSAIVLLLILTTLMMPEEIIAVPLYLVLSDMPLLGFNLLDSYAGMVLPLVGWAFSIFILTKFMSEIPLELEEAAKVDGAGDLRILFSIIVPLVKPAVGTVTVFSFLMVWDQYLLPLIVAQDRDMYTLPIALRGLRMEPTVTGAQVMAAAMMAMIPTVIVYLLLQKAFQRGLTSGSLKG